MISNGTLSKSGKAFTRYLLKVLMWPAVAADALTYCTLWHLPGRWSGCRRCRASVKVQGAEDAQ